VIRTGNPGAGWVLRRGTVFDGLLAGVEQTIAPKSRAELAQLVSKSREARGGVREAGTQHMAHNEDRVNAQQGST